MTTNDRNGKIAIVVGVFGVLGTMLAIVQTAMIRPIEQKFEMMFEEVRHQRKWQETFDNAATAQHTRVEEQLKALQARLDRKEN